jgi:hypothetical protein
VRHRLLKRGCCTQTALHCLNKINVFAGASARGIGQFKALLMLQSILLSNLFLAHINPIHSFVSFCAFSTLLYYLLSSSFPIFHINYGDKPTYSCSSHRNAAFETSSWSHRLNHLHSRQCSPYRLRCRPHCLSSVSICTSDHKSIHLLFPRYLAGETAAKNPYLNPIHNNHNNCHHHHHHHLTNKENGSLQRRLSLPHLHLCRLLLAVSANLVSYRSHPPLNDLLYITANRARERRHPALLSLLLRHRIFLLLSLNSTLAIIKTTKLSRRPWTIK